MMNIYRKHFRMLLFFAVAVLLTACGGGGGGSDPATESAVSTGITTEPTNTEPTITGSVYLEWTAPATRADGSPLSLADISGYGIYYGDSPGNYQYTVKVADGAATDATVTDIPVGTYYMAMTTYDVDGRESAYSAAIKKTAL
jgi:hypothetical protein